MEKSKKLEMLISVVLACVAITNILYGDLRVAVVYIFIASLYTPKISDYLREHMKFEKYYQVKLILAFGVLWTSVGIGNISEMLGF